MEDKLQLAAASIWLSGKKKMQTSQYFIVVWRNQEASQCSFKYTLCTPVENQQVITTSKLFHKHM